MSDPALLDLILRISVFACITVIAVTLLILKSRTKVAKQKTIQKLIEAGKDLTPELLDSLGLKERKHPNQDLRRGIILIITGTAITISFKFMGGVGWIFGFIPICLGLVYILFSRSIGLKQ